MLYPLYFDNHSATQPSEAVLKAMSPYLTNFWGLPTALHQKGQELMPALTTAFKTIYEFLGASDDDQVILTSSGAESVNHVINSVYRHTALAAGKNHFLTSCVSEAPSIMSINSLQPFGGVGKLIGVNEYGVVTTEAITELLSSRTALISLSSANALTGVIQPLEKIAQLCSERGVLLHVDVTHTIGKVYEEISAIGADYVTFNAQQLHIPRGAGVLYVRKGLPCSPFIYGGTEQGGLRAGAIDMCALVGLAQALREAHEQRDFMCMEIARLRNKLERGILKNCMGAKVAFSDQDRLPNTTTIFFPLIMNEAFIFALNRRGLCATIGGGQFQQLAIQLAAMQITPALVHSGVSFSLSRYTTEEEVDEAITMIVETFSKLMRLSQHLKDS